MEDILGASVPIVFFLFLGAVIIVGSYFRNRERERLHETLRLMVEKGQPVSGELLESMNSASRRRRPPPNDLRRGVVLIAVALALLGAGLAGRMTGYNDSFGPLVGVAAFPGFLGLGFVVLGLVGRSRSKA